MNVCCSSILKLHPFALLPNKFRTLHFLLTDAHACVNEKGTFDNLDYQRVIGFHWHFPSGFLSLGICSMSECQNRVLDLFPSRACLFFHFGLPIFIFCCLRSTLDFSNF
eukprot:RCo044025